jgi:hypothetical protein
MHHIAGPKPTERESLVVAVRPPLSVAATQAASGLVACDYTYARASAQQVFKLLDCLKNRFNDLEGKWHHFFTLCYCLMLLIIS